MSWISALWNNNIVQAQRYIGFLGLFVFILNSSFWAPLTSFSFCDHLVTAVKEETESPLFNRRCKLRWSVLDCDRDPSIDDIYQSISLERYAQLWWCCILSKREQSTQISVVVPFLLIFRGWFHTVLFLIWQFHSKMP
jgi:hypothetical protein